MGVFLNLTFELHSADTRSQNKLLGKIIDYFCDNLSDIHWQELISKETGKNAESQIAINVILRFFRQKMIEEGNLKSYAKYIKKDECLIIDPIFTLEDYMNLNEDELREKICNDVLRLLESILTKYRERFNDFDVTVFMPFLRDRVKEIKSGKLPYLENNQIEDLLDGLLDEDLNLIE